MDWKSIEAACDQAVIGAFGELVRHQPFTTGGVADASRPITELRAILHTPAANGAISLGNGILTTLSSSEGALVVSRVDYPSLIFKAPDPRAAASAAASEMGQKVKSAVESANTD